MMKRWIVFGLALSFTFFQQNTQMTMFRSEAKTDIPSGRAISLKVLQSCLKDSEKADVDLEELVHMAGITRLIGVVADKANEDVILVGQRDALAPELHLEDFVVALRNAQLKYAELAGDTYYYSSPGCSIDPNPEVIGKLSRLAQEISATSSEEQIEEKIENWQRICRSPQEVSVFGVPFQSLFAKVMVDADYEMKSIVDGSDSLEIAGFLSLTDMKLQKAYNDVLNEQTSSVACLSMNRFWFYPGKNSYLEDKGVLIIDTCQVQLLTEEEYLTKRGDITGTGRPDPLAEQFAKNFTAHYHQIANARLIYQELENLFRWVALAKLLSTQDIFQEAGLSLDYFLDSFRVPEHRVEPLLPGRPSVKGFTLRQDDDEGYSISKMWLPTCGGVGIDLDIGPQNLYRDKTNTLLRLKTAVLESRPSTDKLWWDLVL